MNEMSMKMMERLIRDSERLAVVKDYVTKNKYIDKETILSLLGAKEGGEK